MTATTSSTASSPNGFSNSSKAVKACPLTPKVLTSPLLASPASTSRTASTNYGYGSAPADCLLQSTSRRRRYMRRGSRSPSMLVFSIPQPPLQTSNAASSDDDNHEDEEARAVAAAAAAFSRPRQSPAELSHLLDEAICLSKSLEVSSDVMRN